MPDPLFADVAHEHNSNTAMIQRKFEIGYNWVGRLMEQLEKAGIVAQQEALIRMRFIQDEEELMRVNIWLRRQEHDRMLIDIKSGGKHISLHLPPDQLLWIILSGIDLEG